MLELMRQAFCRHIAVLPEAAGIVFGGGFPRSQTEAGRRAAQRAIFYIQRELEAAMDGSDAAIVLCDRGTPDGLAYWPGPDDLWTSVGTTLDAQLQRYDAVIHLRTPQLGYGYNHQNPLRIESAEQAAAIDARIAQAWASHPRRFMIASAPDFLTKAAETNRVLETIVTGKGAHGVVVSQDGKRAFIANIVENTVSVIDTETQKVVRNIKVGEGPNGITFRGENL